MERSSAASFNAASFPRASIRHRRDAPAQVTFGAEGTFALPAGPLRAPCDLPVEIAAGGLTVFGKRFELPIAGPGLVRVLYHDSTMRIFESPLTSQDKWEESGLVVVQVRESAVINS